MDCKCCSVVYSPRHCYFLKTGSLFLDDHVIVADAMEVGN